MKDINSALFSLVILQILHGALSRHLDQGDDLQSPETETQEERCGYLDEENSESCGVSCGLRNWSGYKSYDQGSMYKCDTDTNLNYGRHQSKCWISAAEELSKWCFTLYRGESCLWEESPVTKRRYQTLSDIAQQILILRVSF